MRGQIGLSPEGKAIPSLLYPSLDNRAALRYTVRDTQGIRLKPAFLLQLVERMRLGRIQCRFESDGRHQFFLSEAPYQLTNSGSLVHNTHRQHLSTLSALLQASCGSNSVVECLVANENVASSSLVSRSAEPKQPSCYQGGCFFVIYENTVSAGLV